MNEREILALQVGEVWVLFGDRHGALSVIGSVSVEARMNERYVVELTQDEREQLEALVRGGSRLVRDLKRAQILLAADQNVSDSRIAAAVRVGTATPMSVAVQRATLLLRDVVGLSADETAAALGLSRRG